MKAILIFFLVSSFFLEDLERLLSFQKQTVTCFEDPVKENSSDAKEKDGEEKNDEFKIGLKAEQFLYKANGKKKFYPSHVINYFQYCLEVNSPPPDFT